MDESVPSAGARVRSSRARQFSRSPVLFASVQLGKNLNGFILNASEGGLCVQTAREIRGEEALELRFQSVRPERWVQARGRIVWTNQERTVAGLEFVEMTSEIVSEMRNWLAFGDSLKELRGNWWPEEPAAGGLAREQAPINRGPEAATDAGGGEREDAALERAPLIGTVVSATADSPHSLRGDFGQAPTHSEISKRGYPAGVLAIGAAFVVLVVILFGQQDGFVGHIRRIFPKREAAPSQSFAPAQRPSPGPHSPLAPSALDDKRNGPPEQAPMLAKAPERAEQSLASGSPGPTGTASSGMVLQVGAMSEAGNANKLVQTLRGENFPAFVSMRGSERFNFVLVGPYGDVAVLREAKKALRAKGYEAIEKHWWSKGSGE